MHIYIYTYKQYRRYLLIIESFTSFFYKSCIWLPVHDAFGASYLLGLNLGSLWALWSWGLLWSVCTWKLADFEHYVDHLQPRCCLFLLFFFFFKSTLRSTQLNHAMCRAKCSCTAWECVLTLYSFSTHFYAKVPKNNNKAPSSVSAYVGKGCPYLAGPTFCFISVLRFCCQTPKACEKTS